MSHDQFGKLPQSPEMQQEILSQELDAVDENLNALKMQGKEVSRRMLTWAWTDRRRTRYCITFHRHLTRRFSSRN
jgi:hypothetical protein